MFATSDRVSPCSARWSGRSVGRVITSRPSSSSTPIAAAIRSDSWPRGPLTDTAPGLISTSTPAGTGTGLRPILLMGSPDVAQHLAADAQLLGPAAGDHAARRRQNRDAHPAQYAVRPVALGVHAPPRPGD